MRWRVAAIVMAIASATAGAQQPQPTFRATTHLVLQTVTVKDKTGQPVEGLTARDFIVTEDGQVQEVAFAEYERLDDARRNADHV